jgi:hypothetical protein
MERGGADCAIAMNLGKGFGAFADSLANENGLSEMSQVQVI